MEERNEERREPGWKGIENPSKGGGLWLNSLCLVSESLGSTSTPFGFVVIEASLFWEEATNPSFGSCHKVSDFRVSW